MGTNDSMMQLKREISARVDRMVVELQRELISKTPKRSGKASRGWRQTGHYDASKPSAQEVLRNDVPYIMPLEEGHSKQAPHGFVTQAIDAVIRKNGNK